MMKNVKYVAPLIIVSLALYLAISVQGATNSFVIKQADDSKSLSLSSSTNLNTLLGSVGLRFVIEFSDALQDSDLTPISAEMGALLDKIGQRYVVQYAGANKYHGFSYPLDLIGDNLGPLAGTPTVSQLAGNSILIRWTTDEYASAAVEVGKQIGQYTKIVGDDLFRKQHEVKVDNLTSGKTYYFRTNNTDRSGNKSVGTEKTFEVVETIYQFLPMVRSN